MNSDAAAPIAQAFRADWERFHPGRTPLGWLLRESGSVPWVRFHALPHSKRYATNDAERRLILTRAHELGDRLLGPASRCWLIQANAVKGGGALIGEYVEEPDGPDAFVFRIYAQPVDWCAARFDPLLTDIANERAKPTLWMSRATGSIFAPYDGGFDLFPQSENEVTELKAGYGARLSARADGL